MTDDVRLRRGLRVDVHPQWLEAVAAWERWLRAAGRSPGTIWLRTYHVLRAAESLPPPWSVTLGDLVAVLDRAEWSAETRKSARSSLRSFFGWAEDDGRIEVNPSAKLPTIAVPAGKPKPIPDDVLEAALAKADASGRLMIMLAAWAGLRRADIAAVHSDDVVGVRCRRMLGGGYGAHSGRHRFATKAYATNRDIFAVQQLLGHSKPETTMRYTQLPDDALRDAVFGIA